MATAQDAQDVRDALRNNATAINAMPAALAQAIDANATANVNALTEMTNAINGFPATLTAAIQPLIAAIQQAAPAVPAAAGAAAVVPFYRSPNEVGANNNDLKDYTEKKGITEYERLTKSLLSKGEHVDVEPDQCNNITTSIVYRVKPLGMLRAGGD